MIKIPTFKTSEASRVYGDYGAEKVAFNLNIDPASVLGSIAGGYTANHIYNKKQEAHNQQQMSERKIENNAYAQVESILRDLKIVFTPINVVFSVNGQVFEIIKAEEMTPHMKQAFLQKDGNYFRDVLMNKINMEIQLAEQAFAQRLLAANGYGQQTKTASYASKQDLLSKIAEEEFEGMVKTASTGIEGIKSLSFSPSFDTLRPFSKSEWFFNRNEMDKVASIFGMRDSDRTDEINLDRLNNEVNVGFLPDRVVYLWNGQLIEQMSLLNMNSEGYEAFQKKDKQFFIDFFRNHTANLSAQLQKEPAPDISKEAGVVTEKRLEDLGDSAEDPEEVDETENDEFEEESDDEDTEKEAASLEGIVDDLVEEEFPVVERVTIDPFRDPDIHPVAYDAILAGKYGTTWARHELESIIKQIELDFNVEKGLTDNVLNKIAVLHAVAPEEHSMYLAPLTFEKFIRGMNSKSVLFDEFQGNISFEEILFGIEVAKAYDGDEVFLQFHDNIAPYIAEELMQENIRFVSTQVFDESNPSEKSFYDSVNGFLLRKWKERDAQGIIGKEEVDRRHVTSIQIVEIADEVIKLYADEIEVSDPYTSVDSIISTYDLLASVEPEFKTGVKNAVKENVATHLMAAIFVEYKHQELEYTLNKLQEEGVIRG